MANQKRLLAYFQIGIATLFVTVVFGIGAQPAHACGFGSSIAGGQCRGFITVGTTTFTVPADWNSASNTIELIGGGSNGGISGGNGGVGGGGGAYSKITNQSLSGTVGLAVSQANHSSQATYICSDNTGNCSISSGANGSSVIAVACSGNGQSGGVSSGSCSSNGVSLGTAAAGGGGGNGGANKHGGGGGGAGGANGIGATGGNGTSGAAGTGGTGDNTHGGAGGCPGGNGTEWDSSHGSGGGGNGGVASFGCDGGNYGAGGGGDDALSGVGGAGQPGLIVITYAPLVVLTQRAFIFENDNGPTVDQNTTSTKGTLQAQQGQRFVVRFQIDNTGGSTTTQYSVQFDHNDGVFKTVTSGEISIQLGISGTDGDAITTEKAGACQGGTTFTNGEWHERTATSTNYTLANGNCTELAWIFSTATAVPGTTYNFRLYNLTSGKILDGSTATPTITIVSSQTKNDSKTGVNAEASSAPSNANDLTYYLDATGYSAVASDDAVWDTATSTGSNVPVEVFKLKNPDANNTDQATITWDGQSNVSSQVDLDIWNGSSWENVQSNASPTVNTDFTLTGAKTGSGYYYANFFIYVRVKQAAGAEALRTDQISASFSAPVTSAATLTQRSFIFENDNGTTADTNTQRGTGIAYPVEKGERFIVRFQVDNTGAGATSAKFTVQYDHNDGSWKSVTSGEIATQLGISGSNGDALSLNKAGACQSGTSFVNGTWQEGTATTGSFTLNNGNCTEFGFVFSTATAVPRTTYRFRLVNGSNGNQVFSSVATPTIVLVTLPEKIYSKTGLGAELSSAPSALSDLPYYLDSTGYAAIAAKDGVYDTASSSGAGNTPIALFKIRNYNENTTDSFTITWVGHSNVAPSSNNVFLDIWDNTHSTWITASTNSFSAAGSDFTFSTATSGSLFYDSNYFVYVRVRQAAGVEALSTDQATITFGSTVNLPGYQVDRADTLSDSRPGVSANNTVVFTVTMSVDASERVELTWPSAFAFPASIDCGSVDVATGTQFLLSTTSSNCAATATTWGAEFFSDTRMLRITAPSNLGTYVATGTQITITIGTNATYQQTGTSQIVNPSSAGTYTISVGGNFAGTGSILVAINPGVTVQAQVAESLSLTVSSVAAINCTADDGATVSAFGTTPTSVPFGNISPNAFYIGCQDLVVSTNAGGGYSLTPQEQTLMLTSNGQNSIPNTACDGGGCNLTTAASWTNATNNGFGHTCANQVNHDCASTYSSGTKFRPMANIANGDTPQAIMSSSTPASATGRIKYRLSAANNQATGTYSTTIVYIILPTF